MFSRLKPKEYGIRKNKGVKFEWGMNWSLGTRAATIEIGNFHFRVSKDPNTFVHPRAWGVEIRWWGKRFWKISWTYINRGK